MSLMHWQAGSLPLAPPGKSYMYIHTHTHTHTYMYITEATVQHTYLKLTWHCKSTILQRMFKVMERWIDENTVKLNSLNTVFRSLVPRGFYKKVLFLFKSKTVLSWECLLSLKKDSNLGCVWWKHCWSLARVISLQTEEVLSSRSVLWRGIWGKQGIWRPAVCLHWVWPQGMYQR